MDFAKELAYHTPKNWVKDEETCSNRLKDENFWNSIPLINAVSTQYLKDAALVRFRGMIQDMYDPEYYHEKYEVVHRETREKSVRNGKYSDTAQWNEEEEFVTDSSKNVLNDRQTFVVITAPGKNGWVENIEKEKFKTILPAEQSTSCVKRPREEENMETDETFPEADTTSKKTCKSSAENSNQATVSVDCILNFPLPGSSGKVCHLKIYKDMDDLKLNELCEFVGFLSLDPILSHESYHSGEFDNPMEVQTHNPPPSLVPRIHCVGWKKLTHNNPLVETQKFSCEKMGFLKGELLVVLTQILLGDRLAAEYLLYHLISSVYVRKDFLALGKFCVNISNIPLPQNIDISKELYKFIELFVPQSYYFPMTLENMNDLAFTPKKDHESNRLISGILQLNNNTHLVLDETKLNTGKLNESGIRAVGALANAVQSQVVRYDFGFNITQEFDCDIPFLILSEGKSMLPSDFHVKLEPDETCLKTFNEITEAARHFLKPELLNDIRVFLSLARFGDYNLPESVQDKIQEEFVSMRQNNKTTADDLHQLLVLTRLICLSEGKSLLDDACWKKACDLEAERKSRIANK